MALPSPPGSPLLPAPVSGLGACAESSLRRVPPPRKRRGGGEQRPASPPGPSGAGPRRERAASLPLRPVLLRSPE